MASIGVKARGGLRELLALQDLQLHEQPVNSGTSKCAAIQVPAVEPAEGAFGTCAEVDAGRAGLL